MSSAGRDSIAKTYAVIRPYIRVTPVLETAGADFGLPGAALTLKLEYLQHSGSFKSRGAFTNLLTREVPSAGVVAASGGNHGAAVAYAAMRHGIPATIFVPTDAEAGGVAADSLAPRRVGEKMFPFAQRHVREVILVTDDEIRTAQSAMWETLRIAAEPGGAAAFAALTSHRYIPREGERIGVLVCGANTEWRP